MKKTLEKRVEVLEEIVKQLGGKIPFSVKASKVGDTFDIVGLQWKILDITDKGYLCLADRLKASKQFDSSCNDWRVSELRKYLNGEFWEMLAAEVGAENVISFKRDLLSLDGQTEFGTCEDKVSLLNVDEYRKYRALISNADYWWWLLSPWSTPCNDYTTSVTVVSPSGYVYGFNFFNYCYGVRPFCIFSPEIFESEDK